MNKLYFKCTFLSDVILQASSNSEGNIEKLDFIPGSNFLGMVAKRYKDFKINAKKVFHDGKVRFGDATILIDDDISYHVPFSWYAPKDTSIEDAKNNLYNEYYLTKDEYDELIKDTKQPKQQRVGYFNANGAFTKVDYIYRQKSAYDKKNRRSKKSKMFGFYALPKDLEWIFSVEIDKEINNEKIITLITKTVINAKYLGKARNAEYGSIKIEQIEKTPKELEQNLTPIKIDDKYYVFLYANSRLALFDELNLNSYIPSLSSLDIEDGGIKIDFKKSYIRTSRYTPYVDKRANFDFERLVINKGSVIAVEVNKDFDVKTYSKKIENGVGLYLSEGFGKVIVNPTFVTKKNPFNEIKNTKKEQEIETKGGFITDWLKEQKEKEKKTYELLKRVKEFINNPNNDVKNKKSQWGQIRSLCNISKDDDDIFQKLFSEEMKDNHPKGFLLHGKANEKWSNELIKSLKKEKEKESYLKFIKLLSIYAPKEDDKKETHNG